jgi:phosphatidylserine decarboxylase
MSVNTLISGLFLSFFLLVPLGIKCELEKKVILPAALFIGITSWVITELIQDLEILTFYHVVILQIALIGLISATLLLWRFFRDPDRVTPVNENAIFSPADGKIIYIKKIEKGQIPYSEKHGKKFSLRDFVQSDLFQSGGYLIGIAMNYLDVHVNRAPIPGKVALLKHVKGLFLSLKKREAVIQNERVLTVIEDGHVKVGIVQIASRMVRRIITYLCEGDQVTAGQRIGMIRFGSQVDVIIPDLHSLRVQVRHGQKVAAGLSILATLAEKDHT